MSHDFERTANLLDGAALARSIREDVGAEVTRFTRSGAPPPRLRVLLVGENAASESYVAGKTRAATDAGLEVETRRLASGDPPQRLLDEVDRARRDAQVDGLLVQLPLPAGHDRNRVLDALDPLQDVDGFHPENVGLLHQGRPRFVPCTPAGILALLDAHEIPLSGRRAVVVGRSEIVGKPVAALLTARDATVTLAHSRTSNLPDICREADILVAAIGRPGFVTAEFVRDGAAVVDVGINRLQRGDALPPGLAASSRVRDALGQRGRVLVGDVDFDAVSPVARWITPVPGGVGPLTVAMLLRNTLLAARLRRGLLE